LCSLLLTVIQLTRYFHSEKPSMEEDVYWIFRNVISYVFFSLARWKKIQRFQLALHDENIATCKLASTPRGIVKIRNGSMGCGLSAIGVNKNIHDEVFLTFLRVPWKVRVHARIRIGIYEEPPLSYESFRTRAWAECIAVYTFRTLTYELLSRLYRRI